MLRAKAEDTVVMQFKYYARKCDPLKESVSDVVGKPRGGPR